MRPVVLAVVRHRLPCPERGDDLERFVEHPPPYDPVDGVAERPELLLVVGTEPHSEDEPPAGDPVERHRLAGDLGRPAPGQRRDHRAQEHPLGRQRHRGECDLRVGRGLAVPAEVVPAEHRLPAGLLGEPGQAGQRPRVGVVAEIGDPHGEVHGRQASPRAILPVVAEPATPHEHVDWRELTAVILLSVTTVLTAWSGFESSKWGGAMSISFSQASSARIQAARLDGDANRKVSVQVALYTQWLESDALKNTQLADYIAARFPEPLKTAFAAWLATEPRTNPQAPSSPFVMPEYAPPSRQPPTRPTPRRTGSSPRPWRRTSAGTTTRSSPWRSPPSCSSRPSPGG